MSYSKTRPYFNQVFQTYTVATQGPSLDQDSDVVGEEQDPYVPCPCPKSDPLQQLFALLGGQGTAPIGVNEACLSVKQQPSNSGEEVQIGTRLTNGSSPPPTIAETA